MKHDVMKVVRHLVLSEDRETGRRMWMEFGSEKAALVYMAAKKHHRDCEYICFAKEDAISIAA